MPSNEGLDNAVKKALGWAAGGCLVLLVAIVIGVAIIIGLM